MKKALLPLALCLLLLCASLPAKAAPAFSLQADTPADGTVTVRLSADGSLRWSALQLTVETDKNAQIVSVKPVAPAGTSGDANLTGGKAYAVFLVDSQNADTAKAGVLLEVTLKATAAGTARCTLTVEECVDWNGKTLAEPGTTAALDVTFGAAATDIPDTSSTTADAKPGETTDTWATDGTDTDDGTDTRPATTDGSTDTATPSGSGTTSPSASSGSETGGGDETSGHLPLWPFFTAGGVLLAGGVAFGVWYFLKKKKTK